MTQSTPQVSNSSSCSMMTSYSSSSSSSAVPFLPPIPQSDSCSFFSYQVIVRSPSGPLGSPFKDNLVIPCDLSIALLDDAKDETLTKELLDTLENYKDQMLRFVRAFMKESQAAPTQQTQTDQKVATASSSGFSTPRPLQITVPLCSIVHDLKVPLHNIQTIISILRAPSLPEKDSEDLRNDLVESYKHLNGILDTLKNQKMDRDIELQVDLSKPFTLQRLIQRVQSATKESATQDLVELQFSCDSVDTELKGDFLKLSQILINLVGNAIAFSPKGGTVTISFIVMKTEKKKITIRFGVRDNGPGIKKEDQDKLFKRFSRAASATDTQMEASTGLGLYISQEFTRLMRGEIKLESEPGKGSYFYFDLEFNTGAVSPPSATSTSPLPQPGIGLAKRTHFILVAEDNTITQKLIQRAFKGAKQLMIHSHARAAINCFAEANHFDIVLLDMHMPDGPKEKFNGLTASTTVEAVGGVPHVKLKLDIKPLVALTGLDAIQEIYNIAIQESRRLPHFILCSGDSIGSLEKTIQNHPAMEKIMFFPKPTNYTEVIEKINGLPS